jgi:hypothetical protein
MRHRTTIAISGLALAAAVAASAFAAVEPLAPLRGSPLDRPVHLRLIVAGAPPYVYDVDRGTVTPFAGAVDPGTTVGLVPYGTGAVATVDPGHGRNSSLFLSATDTHRSARRAEARAARTASLRFDVARGPDNKLTFVDRATWKRRVLPWRSILGYLDGALVQPHGPYVAIGFADPAYPGPPQAEDVFLLDRRSGSLTHVPGFPASIRLKFSSMAWAADGRLVLLVRDEDGARIGTYRPGDRSVALRRVALPAPTGGSDQFVPIVSARSTRGHPPEGVRAQARTYIVRYEDRDASRSSPGVQEGPRAESPDATPFAHP